MGFIEIERTKKVGKEEGIDAIYRITDKGIGTLRFTKNGLESLKDKIKGLDVSKTFKLYIDKETKSLAFKQTDQGGFRFSGIKNGKYALSYSDLSKEIKQMVKYTVEASKDYTFVLVLAEANKTSSQTEIAQPEVEKLQEPIVKEKKGRAKKSK